MPSSTNQEAQDVSPFLIFQCSPDLVTNCKISLFCTPSIESLHVMVLMEWSVIQMLTMLLSQEPFLPLR